MSNIKTEIISRNCIKPSSPTLPHLKNFRLSLLDQLSPNIHGNMTFFYLPNNEDADFSTKSQLLQKTLSETLTLFYPFAGRLLDAATIDCNDEGAIFVEARTDSPISDFLSCPDSATLDQFLSTTDPETMQMSNGSMVIIKFTSFGCGGTALSVSLTHKIADIGAFLALLKSWTSKCRGVGDQVAPQLDLGAHLLPPREIPNMSASVNIAAEKFTATRLIFSASSVDDLKSSVKNALGKDLDFYPSRVEVVLAFVWIRAMAAYRTKTGSFKPSALFQAVNLRPRMDPPLPDTAVGNFVWPFSVIVEEENELEFHEVVKRMRKAMVEFLDNKVNKFKGEGAFEAVMEALKERGEMFRNRKGNLAAYKCSSWCKFPLFETDFGWGKPVWRTSANKLVSNTIALLDTKEGGVEVLVTLDDDEMVIFERDEELLKYGVVNPSVI